MYCATIRPAQNLFKKFNGGQEPPKAFFDALGQNRDYNVDLIPKFIMANGVCSAYIMFSNGVCSVYIMFS